LREALLLAAAHDILLEPVWIEGFSNTLADTLPRFDEDVPPLAGLLYFDPHQDSLAHLKLSPDCTYFLWNGLSPETRAEYRSAIKSYEYYCSQVGLSAWPATEYPSRLDYGQSNRQTKY
jgi:hypothetical protein